MAEFGGTTCICAAPIRSAKAVTTSTCSGLSTLGLRSRTSMRSVRRRRAGRNSWLRGFTELTVALAEEHGKP